MTPRLERFARLDTAIHRWDPRWKIASLGALLVALALERPGSRESVGWSRDIAPALAGLAVAFGWLFASRIPLAWVARRLAAPAVFLAFLAIVFALAHPVHDATIGPLAISSTGLRLAGLIAVRALSMLLLVFPMFATSPLDRTMKALHRLRVPPPLVEILFFTCRYLFVYGERFVRIERGMRARGFVARLDRRTLAAIGNGIGVALVTSIERTRRIECAMRCRGFDGARRTVDDFATRPADLLAALVALVSAVTIVAWRLR